MRGLHVVTDIVNLGDFEILIILKEDLVTSIFKKNINKM